MLKEIIQQYLENDNEALRHLIKFFLEKDKDDQSSGEDKQRDKEA